MYFQLPFIFPSYHEHMLVVGISYYHFMAGNIHK